MAWNPPITGVPEQVIGAADWNKYVRDNQLVLKTSINDSGKIIALSSTYLADLNGANLTGVAKLATSNTFTAGTHTFNGGTATRLLVPVGTDKWAT